MTYKDLFDLTAPDNPLRQLAENDKATLHAFAVVFSRGQEMENDVWHPLEGLRAVIRDSENLAQLIEREVIHSPLLDGIEKVKLKAMDLPRRLVELSEELNKLTRTGYKSGHERQNFGTQALISMSGLIFARTGKFNDPALAEFLQPMFPVDKDFSEESIARRRSRFRREYPELYESTISKFRRS